MKKGELDPATAEVLTYEVKNYFMKGTKPL